MAIRSERNAKSHESAGCAKLVAAIAIIGALMAGVLFVAVGGDRQDAEDRRFNERVVGEWFCRDQTLNQHLTLDRGDDLGNCVLRTQIVTPENTSSPLRTPGESNSRDLRDLSWSDTGKWHVKDDTLHVLLRREERRPTPRIPPEIRKKLQLDSPQRSSNQTIPKFHEWEMEFSIASTSSSGVELIDSRGNVWRRPGRSKE